jgi:peroxiredoxin
LLGRPPWAKPQAALIQRVFRMSSFPRLLLLAAFAVVLSGCVEPAGPLAPTSSRTTMPDISGNDSEGKPLKLSDYRGKVVLVDFWMDQCAPCRLSHVHERTLVQRYEGRPFVILGVNVDPKLETMRRSQKEQKMAWRSIWDGPKHENARAYDIYGLPQAYLFDAQGRLAKKLPTGLPDEKMLDNDIERLVRETEQSVTQTAAK